jgi:hypothetical protein
MAKRKVTTEYEIPEIPDPPTPEAAEPEVSPEQEREEKELNAFFNSFGVDNAKVRLYRIDPINGGTIFVAPCSLDMISEEWIQAHFGAGKYEIRLLNAKGQYQASKRAFVEDPPKPKKDALELDGGNNLQLELFRAELAASREMTLELIRQIGRQNSSGSGSTLAEFAAVMAAMKENMRPAEPVNGPGMVTQAMEILKTGIELGASGTAKPEGGWMGILKDVVTALPAVMAGIKPAPAPAPAYIPPATVAAAPAQIDGGNGHAPDLGPDLGLDENLFNQLRQGVGYLKNKCRLGKDPGLWVDLIVDNLDESYYVELARLAGLGIEDFAKALRDPDICQLPYRPWFEALLKGVKDALESKDVENGESRDGSDVGNDERASE